MSTDHNWYPMMLLFLKEEDARLGEEIKEALRYHLPDEILGYPVNCEPDPNDAGTFYMKLTREKPINHSVFTLTVREFIQNYLGYDINHPLEVADWLTFPSQKLLEVTAGGVHYDGFGELTAIRQKLNYYPQDVWLYLLVAAWQRISDLEGLMQRTGIAGDELGSVNIAAQNIYNIMSLCFLIEKQYAPYPKWFGLAFKRLKCSSKLLPILHQVQTLPTWQDRETALCDAYKLIAQLHNSLGITQALPEEPCKIEKRPYKGIHADIFVEAILQQITDPEVKNVISLPLIGGIDQWNPAVNICFKMHKRKALKSLFLPVSNTTDFR